MVRASWTTWLLSGVAALLAAAPAGRAQEVRVTVVVILATDRNAKIDKELECLAREVRKKKPNLTGFRIEETTRKSLTVGTPETFALVDKETATVLVRHGCNAKNRVALTVKPPLAGEIKYTTCCGKFLPILTRYETRDKETLILAVRVQPCKGK
jgi:hypothetical protein